jgi:hypothetical protein
MTGLYFYYRRARGFATRFHFPTPEYGLTVNCIRHSRRARKTLPCWPSTFSSPSSGRRWSMRRPSSSSIRRGSSILIGAGRRPPLSPCQLNPWSVILTSISDLRDGIRVLRDVNTDVPSASMTVPACLDACASKGYSLAGVEFGRECCLSASNPTQLTRC